MPDYSQNLIIGLGGVGGRAIAAFRKTQKLRDTDSKELDKIHAQIEFLYIDSHNDILSNKKRWEVHGRSIELNKNDIIDIKGNNTSLNIVERTANISPWIGDINRHLGEKIGKTTDGLPNVSTIVGANQLRRYGRALFALNASNIRTPLRDKINKLSVGSKDCNFHIFATLGGGTGSGSIIDMVTMINEMCKGLGRKCNIYLYVFVAGEAALENNAGSFYENEFAALRDINALMTPHFHPYMAGVIDKGDDNLSTNSDPIKTVYVSSELASSHLDLDGQVDYMAEGCFDIIHASVVGNLSESVQKAFSGEDLLVTNPGEPNSQDLQRSYRFSSFGMRRWRVPTDEMREALKNKLGYMVYHRWITGSQNYSPGSRRECGLDIDTLIDNGKLSASLEKLAAEYKQKIDSLCKPEETDPETLQQITNLTKGHVKEIIARLDNESEQRNFKLSFSKDVDDIYAKLVAALEEKRSWVAGRNVWGLENIDSFTTDLATRLVNEIDKKQESFDFSACGNMLIRDEEWQKIAFLTKLTGKPKSILRCHQ